MRAISLWQPWATAIALGSKTIETRHWSTAYRGPLAIHAAQRKIKSEIDTLEDDPVWRGALHLMGFQSVFDVLPFGAVVATCYLAGCLTSEECERNRGIDLKRVNLAGTWTERDMGGFADGRYGWILESIKPLAVPLPFKGKQGFFDVPDHLLSGVAKPPAPDLFA